MDRTVRIGIIGDYDAGKISHPVTNSAIEQSADVLSVEADVTWLPTESFLTPEGMEKLKDFDAYWASSGSPYRSAEGALSAIRIARETGKPFIGT